MRDITTTTAFPDPVAWERNLALVPRHGERHGTALLEPLGMGQEGRCYERAAEP